MNDCSTTAHDFSSILPGKLTLCPENHWLGSDVFPIEIVPFLGDIRSLGVTSPLTSQAPKDRSSPR